MPSAFRKYSRSLIGLALVAACHGENVTSGPGTPPPVAPVLLKDIVIDRLPAPYYHFEYDNAGVMTGASFASDLTNYTLSYTNGRLSEMRNNIIVNKDRLEYFYDDAGRVASVRYADSTGVVYAVLFFTYSGAHLTGLERDRRVTGGFIVDKTMALSYGPGGNLSEVTEHHPAIAGVQDEATFVDRYGEYDTGTNVDGFSILHSEFFDHLVLLPQVVLQKSNPHLTTRTGDGINYRVEDTYTYDALNRPLTKTSSITITNGSSAGQTVQGSTVYSYWR